MIIFRPWTCSVLLASFFVIACGGSSPEPATPVASIDAQPASEPMPEPAPGQQHGDDDDPLTTPVDVAMPPTDALRTQSGLSSRVLRIGRGQAHPGPTDRVSVHYSGWTTDGNMFDSSWQRGRPASFPLDRVIAGWTEGVQLMVEGEIRRFWIPADLAYGNSGQGGRPQGMLVFDVELIAIEN